MNRVWGSLVVVMSLVAGLGAQSGSRPREGSAGTPVNLNTATVAQLEALPGIGARTAERIVEHRQKHGGFKKIEDLMQVRGVGEKSFLKLKPMLTVAAAKAERPAPPQAQP